MAICGKPDPVRVNGTIVMMPYGDAAYQYKDLSLSDVGKPVYNRVFPPNLPKRVVCPLSMRPDFRFLMGQTLRYDAGGRAIKVFVGDASEPRSIGSGSGNRESCAIVVVKLRLGLLILKSK